MTSVETNEYRPGVLDRWQDYWHDHKHATVISGVAAVVFAGSGLVVENVMNGIPAHLVSGFLEYMAVISGFTAGKTWMELQDDYSNPSSVNYIPPNPETD